MKQVNFKQCVVINQSTEKIFAYMSNLEHLVDWSSIVIAARKGSLESECIGATTRSTIRFLGSWQDITFEIVEYQRNRSLTIKSISGTTPCLFYYQFEASEDGSTMVSQEAQLQLIEGGSDQPDPVVINAARRQLEYDLLTLKDMLEAEPSASPNANYIQ